MLRARRGGILVIVALSITVIAGFVALVFDVGYLRMEGMRLQMASDAAAHAAAKELNGTEEGLGDAITAASSVAGMWTIAGNKLTIGSDEVEFGTYDGAGTFVSETDPALINALRVSASADLPLFFGAIAFDSSGSVAAGRTTLVTTEEGGGAYASDCVLPVAVPACEIDAGIQNKVFDAGRFGEQYGALVGQTIYQTARGVPYSFFSETIFKNLIADCYARGDVSMDDTERLSMSYNSVSYTDVLSALNSSSTSWDSSKWGAPPSKLPGSGLSASSVTRTLEGPVPVIDDDAYCTSTLTTSAPNASAPIVGFIWGAIYDVAKTTGTCGSTSANLPKCERLRFRVDITDDYYYGTQSGGPDYGVLSTGNSRFLDASF